MMIFFTDERKQELEKMHDTTRDGRVRDRIKAVLLASEGWSKVMIAQALRIHQTTVDRHLEDYFNEEKLKPQMAVLMGISVQAKRKSSSPI